MHILSRGISCVRREYRIVFPLRVKIPLILLFNFFHFFLIMNYFLFPAQYVHYSVHSCSDIKRHHCIENIEIHVYIYCKIKVVVVPALFFFLKKQIEKKIRYKWVNPWATHKLVLRHIFQGNLYVHFFDTIDTLWYRDIYILYLTLYIIRYLTVCRIFFLFIKCSFINHTDSEPLKYQMKKSIKMIINIIYSPRKIFKKWNWIKKRWKNSTSITFSI